MSVSPLLATGGNVAHCSHSCNMDVGRMGEESPAPSFPDSRTV